MTCVFEDETCSGVLICAFSKQLCLLERCMRERSAHLIAQKGVNM